MIFRYIICTCIMHGVLLFSSPAMADVPQNVDVLVAKSGLQSEIDKQPEAAIMLQTIKDHISRHMTSSDIDAVLEWFNSDLGQKITKAEEDASSMEAYSQMREIKAGLQSHPPDPFRKQLISNLDQAARMTEYMTRMKMSMVITMTEATPSATSIGNASKEERISQIKSRRGQVQELSSKEVMARSLFTYRSISDNELEQYIVFYKSEAGKKYVDTVTEALLTAIEDSNKRWAIELGGTMEQNAPDAVQ